MDASFHVGSVILFMMEVYFGLLSTLPFVHGEMVQYICPEVDTNVNVECGKDEAIKVNSATFAMVETPNPCNISDIEDQLQTTSTECKYNSSFSICDGEQSCSIEPSMAAGQFEDCSLRYSILSINYSCVKVINPEATKVIYPIGRNESSQNLQIFSPYYPCKMPAFKFNIQCDIDGDFALPTAGRLEIYWTVFLNNRNGTQCKNRLLLDAITIDLHNNTRHLVDSCDSSYNQPVIWNIRNNRTLKSHLNRLVFMYYKQSEEEGGTFIQQIQVLKNGNPVEIQLSCKDENDFKLRESRAEINENQPELSRCKRFTLDQFNSLRSDATTPNENTDKVTITEINVPSTTELIPNTEEMDPIETTTLNDTIKNTTHRGIGSIDTIETSTLNDLSPIATKETTTLTESDSKDTIKNTTHSDIGSINTIETSTLSDPSSIVTKETTTLTESDAINTIENTNRSDTRPVVTTTDELVTEVAVNSHHSEQPATTEEIDVHQKTKKMHITTTDILQTTSDINIIVGIEEDNSFINLHKTEVIVISVLAGLMMLTVIGGVLVAVCYCKKRKRKHHINGVAVPPIDQQITQESTMYSFQIPRNSMDIYSEIDDGITTFQLNSNSTNLNTTEREKVIEDMYARVDKSYKYPLNIESDETVMCENNELYEAINATEDLLKVEEDEILMEENYDLYSRA